MAIIHRTAFVRNIGAAVDEALQFSTRGGILLAMKLEWAPFSYIDKGLVTERYKRGDIHCLLIDSATNRSPIGQGVLSGQFTDHIVVATRDIWVWQHPEMAFLESNDVVGRLAYNSAAAEDAIGLVRGNLIVRSFPDAVRASPVAHNLSIESKFLAFDSAFA